MRNKVKEIDVDETVKRLGDGPDCRVKSYQGYDINGYTFYTSDRDKKSAVQNSGVTLIASTTELYGHRRETMIKIAKDSYYGVIQEIWELDYHDFKIPLFRCKWVNNRISVQVDKYGFTLVDLATDGYRSEPFVMAKHVTQVFFVKDPSKPRYHIVLQGKRHILGVDNVVNEEEHDRFDDLPPFSVDIEPSDYENMRFDIYRVEQVMIADGSYNENKEDPLVRVVGPEHGGRSRTVSHIIGYTKVHGGLFKNVNYGRNSIRQVDTCSDGQVNYPPIMSETRCELLINVGDSLVKVVDGKAWPTIGAVLHFKPIMVDCAKVSVDGIVDSYKDFEVYNVTKTTEVNTVETLVSQIIQWPRKSIRLVNQRAPSKSPSSPRVELSSSSPSHTSNSPQINDNDNDTANTLTLCSQKTNQVGRVSPQFHDENFASSSFYQLIDEDNYQPEVLKSNLFEDGYLNALISVDQQILNA
ncbi:uncharacterized protein LOC143604403 [Bidens hawaiensis]|uniref:uncharacterized protein LOC143604403 n=1 Tax=Bidens hawaiensis TaxID=980011 RepID=UPI00404AA705